MQRPLFMEEIGDDGVGHIALTRPDKHNAVNRELIDELTAALHGFGSDPRVRCVVLTGEGPSFCAGGDLEWMRHMATADVEENLADAQALGRLLTTLDELPRPTMALVHGAAIGAGLALVACSDVVIADSAAVFAMPETRLGLVPGVVAPPVVTAIGERAARRYSLTGERFGAAEAHRLGLVHEVVHGGALNSRGREVIESILKGAPGSQRESKAQMHWLRGRALDAAAVRDGATRIAQRRASAEGQEGMAAFLDKRKPSWTPD
jgi:methylglutaconyl-CoA hydratase